MSREHVAHGQILAFAQERVDLKRDDAKDYRAQVQRLREKLEGIMSEHPTYSLRKTMLSGSLAKGTALKSLNDIDLACYISTDGNGDDMSALIDWLAGRLRKAWPNFKPEQVVPQTYSVTVRYAVSGLSVDVVPILYDGDEQGRGWLVSSEDGSKLMTSIPMHLEFIRRRKAEDEHFARVVRLVKYWARLQKSEKEGQGFRFKSFMIELLLAKLADNGVRMNDYVEALAAFFNHLGKDGLKSIVAFSDYYNPALCKKGPVPVHIWDPVNCDNNVSRLYTEKNRMMIVEAAYDAAEAIDSAIYATTKGETVRYWQKVFGPAFNP